jgi:Uma2 family endonuclease
MAPQGDHAIIAKHFVRGLAHVGEDRELGIVFVEGRFVTPGWSPVPDVSYYRKERLQPQSRRRVGDLHTPPDIAIEIVSPDQTVSELLRKCLRYADLGVVVSLIVDPDDESIFAVRPGQPLQVLRGDDRIDLDDALPGFELTVRHLFDSILPGWVFASDRSEDTADQDEPGGATA